MKRVQQELEQTNYTPEPIKIIMNAIGEDLSKIINIDGDLQSDGETVDLIVQYLIDLGIYKERK